MKNIIIVLNRGIVEEAIITEKVKEVFFEKCAERINNWKEHTVNEIKIIWENREYIDDTGVNIVAIEAEEV